MLTQFNLFSHINSELNIFLVRRLSVDDVLTREYIYVLTVSVFLGSSQLFVQHFCSLHHSFHVLFCNFCKQLLRITQNVVYQFDQQQ